MRRTQIYLDEETFDYLKKESQLTRKTMSDIIRARLKEKKERDVGTILRSTKGIFGMWADKELDVDHYVRGTRKDRMS